MIIFKSEFKSFNLEKHSLTPNNEGGNENYAMFYHKSPAYKWNDGNFGNGTNGDDKTFICEWDEKSVEKNQNNISSEREIGRAHV